MAEPTGFEPAISGLTGRRVNQATPRLRLQSVFYHPADPKSSRAAPVAAFSRRPLALGTESEKIHPPRRHEKAGIPGDLILQGAQISPVVVEDRAALVAHQVVVIAHIAVKAAAAIR